MWTKCYKLTQKPFAAVQPRNTLVKESGNEMPESPVWLLLHHPWHCLFLNWEKIMSVRQDLNKFGRQGGSFMVSRSVHIGNNGIWRGERAPSLKLFSLWRGKGRIVNICLWSKEKSLNLLLSCKLQLFVECDWCPVECKISRAERPWGYH